MKFGKSVEREQYLSLCLSAERRRSVQAAAKKLGELALELCPGNNGHRVADVNGFEC